MQPFRPIDPPPPTPKSELRSSRPRRFAGGGEKIKCAGPCEVESALEGFNIVEGAGVLLFPSPLAGEGGSNERSEFETGEGLRSIDRKKPPVTAAHSFTAPVSDET